METPENLVWEEVNCEHIVRDEWIDFRRSTYKMPNGKISGPYYSYSRKDFVIIVATTEDDHYICVKQFRQGIRQVTTEFCAGCIERVNGVLEDTLSAAKRELLEETGYSSDDWRHMLTVPAQATLADNYMSIFVAKNCQKINSQQNLDEDEFLNVYLYSRNELEEMIQNGAFSQASHILAFLMAGTKNIEKCKSLLETTLNTRDLGGYQTRSGRCTNFDKLIRSDMQKYPSERDIAYLLKKHVTTIIDMRGKDDVERAPSPFSQMEAFHYYNAPIEEGSGIPESVEAVPGSYMKIAASENIVHVYRTIAHAPDGVLFHCSAGKDRTGVVSAILLLLAGVGDEDIIENYMMTKECNRERFAVLHQKYPDIDMNIVIPREEYMIRFLQLFREAYGDAEMYFRVIGIQAEEIQLIRDKLLR